MPKSSGGCYARPAQYRNPFLGHHACCCPSSRFHRSGARRDGAARYRRACPSDCPSRQEISDDRIAPIAIFFCQAQLKDRARGGLVFSFPPAYAKAGARGMRGGNAASCFAIALALLAFGNDASAAPNAYAEPISLAINHWLRVQESSGFMPYAFDFLEDAAHEQRGMSAANLTRQAGTAAVLADYYAQTGDQRARPAIQKFLRAFGDYSLPIGKSRLQTLVEKTRVFSMPFGRYKIQAALNQSGLLYQTTGPGKVLSPNADYSKAYTGSVALALLAELRYSQASGDTRFADLRRAWLEGLIGLRIPGDGFRQFPTSIDAIPYFDGESWLALTEYHRAFPQDHRVSELLDDLDATLMKKYGATLKTDFFHWGAMTAAARYADTKEQKFLDFIKAQTGAFLDRKKDRVDNGNNCASVEGVADALGALRSAGEENSALFERARKWTEAEMRKTKLLQIQPGQSELVFSKARISAPRMQAFSGSFRSGIYAADTQVDFTAHCVSAMVKPTRHDIKFVED